MLILYVLRSYLRVCFIGGYFIFYSSVFTLPEQQDDYFSCYQ